MNELKIGKHTIKIKPEWRSAFLATWVVGLLAHAYRFFNFLPIWDSMFNFKGTGATNSSGRVFLGFFSGLTTEYDMAWLNGAVSLFYISIAVVLLVDMFQIRSRSGSILLAALMVSFPTVTSTFAYMFTADGYMMAFLLSVLGVYLTWKWKHGIWPGMVCIGLSMGTYQAYISVTLVVIVVLIIMDFVIEKKTFKRVICTEWKYILLVIGGAVFYKVTSTLINNYYNVTLTAYQGINSMGIMSLQEYGEALYKTIRSLARMWCLQNGVFATNKFGLANLAVVGGILLGTVLLIIKNKTYKNIPGVIATVLAVAALPIAAYAVNFVSPEVGYHTLMEMGVCFIYITLLLYIERGKWEKTWGKLLKTVGVLVLVFLCYYNVVQANFAYTSLNLSYEKSYGVCSNILDRIEQLDEYPEISKVAMMGSYTAESGGYEDLNPGIQGISQKTYLWGDYHYISMWNYCFGRSFALTSGAEKEAIKATQEYQDMEVYPARDCIAVINDTIVVKLSE